MTDAKHTPEPWYVVPIAAGNTTIADRQQGEYVRIAQRVRASNASRIVACVNALRGLDVAKVEALLDAVRAESESLYNDKIPIAEHSRRELARSRASDALRDSIRAGGGQ